MYSTNLGDIFSKHPELSGEQFPAARPNISHLKTRKIWRSQIFMYSRTMGTFWGLEIVRSGEAKEDSNGFLFFPSVCSQKISLWQKKGSLIEIIEAWRRISRLDFWIFGQHFLTCCPCILILGCTKFLNSFVRVVRKSSREPAGQTPEIPSDYFTIWEPHNLRIGELYAIRTGDRHNLRQ